VSSKSASDHDSQSDEDSVPLQQLAEWPITGMGLHPGGSNYVFVVRLTDPVKYPELLDQNPSFSESTSETPDTPEQDGVVPDEIDESASIYAIYKPQSGERPLRDFPGGTLHNRERAAYLVSRELGWPNIPPTVIRAGPHGEGSVQLFIDAAPVPDDREPENYFSLRDERLEDFRDMVMFDALVHNADRKGGSCIVSDDRKLWAIDHGLTFNHFARRRTVMFEFNGTEYPTNLLNDVEVLVNALESESKLSAELKQLISQPEVEDVVTRAKEMIEFGHYPYLDPDANVPWPMV
jgi:uncharacterized repeat protein (TIGR03843 family)